MRPMMTSASSGRDGGDGDGAGRAQRCAAAAALTYSLWVTRAREGGRAMPTDLLGPPERCSWPHDDEVAGRRQFS